MYMQYKQETVILTEKKAEISSLWRVGCWAGNFTPWKDKPDFRTADMPPTYAL